MIYPNLLLDNLFSQIKDKQLEGFLPGKTEIQTKIPFSGKAGKILDNYLEEIGVHRQDVYITSTIRSRPYKVKHNSQGIDFPNRKPTSSELIIFSPLLDFEIKQVNPKILITLGNTALKRILNQKYQISSIHGQLLYTRVKKLNQKYGYTENSYYVFPLFYPASIFYNSKLKSVINNDLNTLKMVLDYLELR